MTNSLFCLSGIFFCGSQWEYMYIVLCIIDYIVMLLQCIYLLKSDFPFLTYRKYAYMYFHAKTWSMCINCQIEKICSLTQWSQLRPARCGLSHKTRRGCVDYTDPFSSQRSKYTWFIVRCLFECSCDHPAYRKLEIIFQRYYIDKHWTKFCSSH